MQKLNRTELRTIEGGSETIKSIGAWLKTQWCAIKNYEAPKKTWKGHGNHVWYTLNNRVFIYQDKDPICIILTSFNTKIASQNT